MIQSVYSNALWTKNSVYIPRPTRYSANQLIKSDPSLPHSVPGCQAMESVLPMKKQNRNVERVFTSHTTMRYCALDIASL